MARLVKYFLQRVATLTTRDTPFVPRRRGTLCIPEEQHGRTGKGGVQVERGKEQGEKGKGTRWGRDRVQGSRHGNNVLTITYGAPPSGPNTQIIIIIIIIIIIMINKKKRINNLINKQ